MKLSKEFCIRATASRHRYFLDAEASTDVSLFFACAVCESWFEINALGDNWTKPQLEESEGLNLCCGNIEGLEFKNKAITKETKE